MTPEKSWFRGNFDTPLPPLPKGKIKTIAAQY